MGEVTQLGGGEGRPGGAVLLCELCGYDITGIALDGQCPECGLPVFRSMPERRIGTPWQRGRGFGAYFTTMREALASPRALLRTATNKPGRNTEFFMWNVLLSGAMPCCAFSLLLGITRPVGGGEVTLIGVALGALFFSLCSTFAIICIGLLVFYVAWFLAALTVGKFPTDTGILAASVASAWLVVGSGMCALAFALAAIVGPLVVFLLPTGLVVGWCGYLVMCYRSLVWVRHANFPHGTAEVAVGVMV